MNKRVSNLATGDCLAVFLESGAKREENLRKVVMQILSQTDVRGRKVLVKPNYTSDSHMLANTLPSALDTVLQEINAHDPDQLTVAEGSTSAFLHGKTTKSALEHFGAWEVIQNNKASFIDLNQPEESFLFDVETSRGADQVRINPVYHDYDILVSLTLPKSHDYAMITGALKNFAMAFVFPQDRMKIPGLKKHAGDPAEYLESVKLINRNLARLMEQVKPDISVIDGFVGMEGDGPIMGTAVDCGWALSSDEPLLCDCVLARLMGLDPAKVGYLNYLLEKHPISPDAALDARISSLIRVFKLHTAAAVQVKWHV